MSISFIDDYNKFIRSYLIKLKYEVFQKFIEFQHLIERQFDGKIRAIQTDWEGGYQKLNPFLLKLVSLIQSHALIRTNKMGQLNESIDTLSKLVSPYYFMLLCC
jgi:hypothetical protein